MANNCLVISLKDAIQELSLRKLGEMKFQHTDDGFSANLTFTGSETVNKLHFRSTGDCYLYKSNGVDFLENIPNCQEATCNVSEKTIKVKGKGYFFCKTEGGTSASNIAKIQVNGRDITVNLDSFNLNTKITSVNIANTIIKGSIDILSYLSNLSTLQLNNAICSPYDIASLGKNTALTTLLNANIEESKASGSLESFVEAQINNGRISGTMETNLNGTDITINGNKITTSGRFIITFENGTAVVKNPSSVTVADYNVTTSNAWYYGPFS